MSVQRNQRYPYHLAKLVAGELTKVSETPPTQKVLLRLFETLYFASLKTDESRLCRCTIIFIESTPDNDFHLNDDKETRWNIVPFRQPIKLDVRSLLKLAEAADPASSSIAVYCNAEGELMIGGLVDQEIRYGDRVALDAIADPSRPGLFQSTITGVGAISVYKNYALIGSLEQNNLITQYHDVLWEGPIHNRLKQNLEESLVYRSGTDSSAPNQQLIEQLRDELLIRWQNSMCRMLYNIQQYGHGGGLLIVPRFPAPELNVKYELNYDRLPNALLQLSQQQIAKRQIHGSISNYCHHPEDFLRYELHQKAVQSERDLQRLKDEVLGCNRFIASLSRVDGFVLLDRTLSVQGFGVEIRSDDPITEITVAGNSTAEKRLLRTISIDQFGTRHRAMIRYCNNHEGTLGFVISQDGDIRAIVKHEGQLILWENINVQLAYRAETDREQNADFSSISDLPKDWVLTWTSLRSA